MDLVEHLRRLFSYDEWANREVLALFRSSGTTPRSIQLMAHILSAERLWLERMRGEKQSLPVWPDFTLPQCEEQAADMAGRWKSHLAASTETSLARRVSYKNSKGEAWASREQDILMHVIMHSAYHRGQIATDLRARGFTPAYTDFIHAVRQGLVE